MNEKILNKIKKCLALSKSSNEHEAAQALKHAKKLIDAHNLSVSDNAVFERTECTARTRHLRHPRWVTMLAGIISEVFECSLFSGYAKFIFVGQQNKPEAAAYCFDVLFRQLQTAKRRYLDTLPSTLRANQKSRLVRAYAEGWCMGVYEIAKDFANPLSDSEKQLNTEFIEAVRNKNVGAGRKQKSAIQDDHTADAARAGLSEGQNASLFHP